jgi:hypothetical protein
MLLLLTVVDLSKNKHTDMYVDAHMVTNVRAYRDTEDMSIVVVRHQHDNWYEGSVLHYAPETEYIVATDFHRMVQQVNSARMA